MKRAFVVMVLVAACGGNEPVPQVDSVEQAVVLGPLEVDPIDLADLTACLEIPDPITLDWLSGRLTYHEGCFDSWVINVPVTECAVGPRVVSGTARVAGTAMARLPRTGLLIRARALAAALNDLTGFATGDSVPRAALDVEGDGLSLDACATPMPGGVRAELDLTIDNPVLGVVDLEGAAEVTLVDGVHNAELRFAMSADPPEGPPVSGELTGTGIVRLHGELCPDAGEVRFEGTIGEEAAQVLLNFVGDGQVVITLPDGTSIGPMTPGVCG